MLSENKFLGKKKAGYRPRPNGKYKLSSQHQYSLPKSPLPLPVKYVPQKCKLMPTGLHSVLTCFQSPFVCIY